MITAEEESSVTSIIAELEKAKKKHPEFPDDPVRMAVIMAEEAGEAIRAANNLCYHGGSIEDLQTELAQTGAMCIRVMAQLMASRSSNDNGKRD